MPTNVRGFMDALEKDNHFLNHANDFDPPFGSADDYEAAAIAFLTGPLRTTMIECVRRSGDVIRYDTTTNEFAICDQDGFLKTYYRPDPAIHKQVSNLAYFRGQCEK